MFDEPAQRDWPAWLAAAGARGVDGNSGLKFENATLAYQAAADLLGVIVALLPFVRDDLADGRLVAPLALRLTTAEASYRQPALRPRDFEEQIDSAGQ